MSFYCAGATGYCVRCIWNNYILRILSEIEMQRHAFMRELNGVIMNISCHYGVLWWRHVSVGKVYVSFCQMLRFRGCFVDLWQEQCHCAATRWKHPKLIPPQSSLTPESFWDDITCLKSRFPRRFAWLMWKEKGFTNIEAFSNFSKNQVVFQGYKEGIGFFFFKPICSFWHQHEMNWAFTTMIQEH